MDLTKGDMLIISGEGDGPGAIERYEGARAAKAIRSRLSRERAGGDRWAHAWIGGDGTYAKLGTDLESTGDQREIDESDIRVNPAAQLRSGKPNPASATNGAKGGRPRKQG